MTQQQKLDLKMLAWGGGIIITILATTFKLGVIISDETNKINNSVEAVRTENRIQQKDIDALQGEMPRKADKAELDNLSAKLEDYTRYVTNRPSRRQN